MQKYFNECLPWLNWKVATVAGVLLVGVGFYAEWSSWSLWAGAAPLLAILACVLPCLLSLLFLWRKGDDGGSAQPK